MFFSIMYAALWHFQHLHGTTTLTMAKCDKFVILFQRQCGTWDLKALVRNKYFLCKFITVDKIILLFSIVLFIFLFSIVLFIF